jgi:hypothetical protein
MYAAVAVPGRDVFAELAHPVLKVKTVKSGGDGGASVRLTARIIAQLLRNSISYFDARKR